MPNNLQDQTKDLIDRYLDLHRQQKRIDEQLDQLKTVIALFTKKTNQKHLKSGNIILKVRQFQKTVFPKIDQQGREAVEEIMRKSKEWKQAITFDIVKLGLAFDKKRLSKTLIKKLTPFTAKEKVIRITKSKVRNKGKHD